GHHQRAMPGEDLEAFDAVSQPPPEPRRRVVVLAVLHPRLAANHDQGAAAVVVAHFIFGPPRLAGPSLAGEQAQRSDEGGAHPHFLTGGLGPPSPARRSASISGGASRGRAGFCPGRLQPPNNRHRKALMSLCDCDITWKTTCCSTTPWKACAPGPLA